MSGSAWAALGVAAYGALLSSLLAWRQIVHERRGLRVIARILAWSQTDGPVLEVLEVRAINERKRPIYVTQAGVVTERGTVYHPATLRLSRSPESRHAPLLLHDGEGVTFYFDLLSFEGEEWTPKAVWVQDQGDRRFTKRIPRERRREIASMAAKLRERLGTEVDTQHELLKSSDS